MSITVYWTVLDKEWLRAREPQSVLKNLYEKRLHEEQGLLNYHKCPFVHDHLVNVFSLHSMYEYSFKIEGERVWSEYYNQEFFDNHVTIRSLEKRAFTFFQPFVFFTEEKSLKASFPMFPYMENNNITQRCMPFEGTIDIGKYFRNIDFAFFLKEPYNEFIIKEDEVFGYVRFHTKEKIKFVKFHPTEKIHSYSKTVRDSYENRKTVPFVSPEFYYNRFSIKKNFLREIKNNIVE